MDKYIGLHMLLANSVAEDIRLTISDIEGAIKDKLPASALRHKAWRGNDKTHVQARAWMNAGYRVVNTADLIRLGCVTLSRL